MRIVAVDARTVSDEARRVVALALAQAPQRVLLFGATGDVAAEQIARELAQRDERFLDVAARWLLERGEGAPPTRAGLEVPLLEIGLAIRNDDRCRPLPASDRAIELVGANLCMAVPERSRVAADEWDNAALWIAGGEPTASVHDERGRPVVVPGDAGGGAGPAVVDVTANEARVVLLDRDGVIAATRQVRLGSGARIMVKAAGATSV